MTAMGPGHLGAVNLAGSVSGTQRNTAETDRAKAGAAERNLQADLKALSAKSMGDIGETDQSADRDADGRRMLDPGETDAGQPDDAPMQAESPRFAGSRHRRIPDATGERGQHLDVEA